MRRLWIVVALVLLGSACGSSSHTGSSGSSSGGNPPVEASFDDTGCKPTAFDVPPGRTTFHVKNDGASSTTEIELLDPKGTIVGEKENLTPGLDGTFTVDLTPGADYTLTCPGGSQHAVVPVHVQGGASSSSSSDDEGAAGTTCAPGGDVAGAKAHVAIMLRDYELQPAATTVAAGTVAFDGTNAGTHPHEVVAVKDVAPDLLPRKADGSIDEDALPAGAKAGELEAFAPGVSCSAVLDLAPGSYTLFCNVVGQAEGAHAKLGMVTTITVS